MKFYKVIDEINKNLNDRHIRFKYKDLISYILHSTLKLQELEEKYNIELDTYANHNYLSELDSTKYNPVSLYIQIDSSGEVYDFVFGYLSIDEDNNIVFDFDDALYSEKDIKNNYNSISDLVLLFIKNEMLSYMNLIYTDTLCERHIKVIKKEYDYLWWKSCRDDFLYIFKILCNHNILTKEEILDVCIGGDEIED